MNYYPEDMHGSSRAFAGPILPFVGGLLVGGLFAPKTSGPTIVPGPSYPSYPPQPMPPMMQPMPAPVMPIYPAVVGPVYGPYPMPTAEIPTNVAGLDQNIFLLNDPTFVSANTPLK